MAELYSNNAEGTLADGIDDSVTEFDLAASVGAERFAIVTGGGVDFQRATITDQDEPDEYEIVHIVERDLLSLTVLRGQEGTIPRAWAAGSKISARVTAKMLDGFLGMDESGVVRTLPGRPSGAFIVNGRSSGAGDVQISGYHVLQLITAAPTTVAGALMPQDKNMTHESVGGSMLVDLGDGVPTWTSGSYYSPYSIVKPPTPNGYSYLFEPTDSWSGSQTSTTPAFSGDEFSCDALDGAAVVGQWVPIPDPLAFSLLLGSKNLVVTEVGFICNDYAATTTPAVSIGTNAAPTRFANAVSLSQIAAAGDVHRIPISAGGATTERLVFSLDTPATGRLIGRFYWRGFFVQLS